MRRSKGFKGTEGPLEKRAKPTKGAGSMKKGFPLKAKGKGQYGRKGSFVDKMEKGDQAV